MGDVAAQLFHSYLPASEAFLHVLLSGLRRFVPEILAWNIENGDRFPARRVLQLSVCRLTPRWAARQVWRCAGIDRELEQALSRCRARLLHAHFGDCAVRALGARKRIPLVSSFYGRDITVLPRDPAWRRRYRRLFSRGDLFLAEGPAMAERMETAGAPPERIRIQRLGVEIPLLPRRAAREEVVVLFCARLTEKKGFPYALRAFAKAAGGDPRLRLRVIAGGDEAAIEEARRTAGDLGVGERVSVERFVPYGLLWDALADADLFLHPSVTARDGDGEGGAPTVLMMASASGLPVVSSRHADIPQVVRDGVTGFLLPERDVDGLAQSIGALARDPALRRGMGGAGRAHIEAEFDVRKVAAALEDLYHDLAGAS
ncbi:MAG: glycosyltransferase [Planctomycetes bacterium]|nr:glycosyltransferase [Planctomycetota bacterium]